MKKILIGLMLAATACSTQNTPINREALVERNAVNVTSFDSLSSVSLGNGAFAFTVDATGLQSFPATYSKGIPLGTMSQWGWHSFPNPNGYKAEESLRDYDFRGHKEPYAVQYKEAGRNKDACDWLRQNPHKIHLGYFGLEMTDATGKEVTAKEVNSVSQKLDMWNGIINSSFKVDDFATQVATVCSPSSDMVSTEVQSPMLASGNMKLSLRFPYPSGIHSDDASNWNVPEKHKTNMIESGDNYAVFERTIDSAKYYVRLQWDGKATIGKTADHHFTLTPKGEAISASCIFSETKPESALATFNDIKSESSSYWQSFWNRGGAVDFSECKDPRAAELERRVVLSQYLTAIQCAGSYPPAETGLTYNSWFGRPHLEMHWWHGVHFQLWGRGDMLERSMDWYRDVAAPAARGIAQRQGFDGVRWMKMTDNWANEGPSSVGSFLTWQQPHYIYFAELFYRANPTPEVVERYKDLVEETAKFMASFATYDEIDVRYILKGMIPAQETLRASEVINPPFELSYWHWALSTAQKWRERAGLERNSQWDIIIDKLSPLASKDGKYLSSEDAVDTYSDIRLTSDHMIVLGAYGMLPKSPQFTSETMTSTFNWIWDNWNWGKTWGWDFPMTAMSAARLGMPDKAVGALLMEKRTNKYLANGHNHQDDRLRLYLPGNGGLLSAVAMMCAGWDGCTEENPGFPKDGNWNVKWEGLYPMP